MQLSHLTTVLMPLLAVCSAISIGPMPGKILFCLMFIYSDIFQAVRRRINDRALEKHLFETRALRPLERSPEEDVGGAAIMKRFPEEDVGDADIMKRSSEDDVAVII